MSVPVALDALRQKVADHGAVAFLLTVAGDGRPHVVSVQVAWDGDDLVAPAGRSTAGNAAARPDVSLLWGPATADAHYSLIVDGQAAVRAGDGGGGSVVITPTRAVLHRLALPDPDGAEPTCIRVLDSGEQA